MQTTVVGINDYNPVQVLEFYGALFSALPYSLVDLDPGFPARTIDVLPELRAGGITHMAGLEPVSPNCCSRQQCSPKYHHRETVWALDKYCMSCHVSD